MIGELIASDHAYVTDDGVYMAVESVDDYGLLAHQSVDDMRSGGGDREVVGAAQKRHPADFVLWKFSKPGRAGVAVAVGRRAARLALRVRRDESRPARGGLRPALRWAGPAVPAPRERARPGGRARQDVRQPLDAQRLRRRRRGREDVEEPRQRVEPARPDRALRPTGVPDGPAAVALPQPGEDHPGRHRCRRQVACRARRVRRPRRRSCRREPDRACSTSSAPRWTTTSTHRRPRRCCSTRSAGPTPRSTPATTAQARLVAAVHEIAGAVGLDLGTAVRGRRRSARPGPGARRGPRRQRTSPPPMRSAPSCRPRAGRSRPPATVRRCDGDHDRRRSVSRRRRQRKSLAPTSRRFGCDEFARRWATSRRSTVCGRCRSRSVLLYHAGFSWMHGGFFGVEVFFVVSGFLITSLLLDERDRDGMVSFRHFWQRRARRLFPALYAVLLAVAVWGPCCGVPLSSSHRCAGRFPGRSST